MRVEWTQGMASPFKQNFTQREQVFIIKQIHAAYDKARVITQVCLAISICQSINVDCQAKGNN